VFILNPQRPSGVSGGLLFNLLFAVFLFFTLVPLDFAEKKFDDHLEDHTVTLNQYLLRGSGLLAVVIICGVFIISGIENKNVRVLVIGINWLALLVGGEYLAVFIWHYFEKDQIPARQVMREKSQAHKIVDKPKVLVNSPPAVDIPQKKAEKSQREPSAPHKETKNLSTIKSEISNRLLGLPIVDDVPKSRQTIVRAESHPSVFIGSTKKTVIFVMKMMIETEKYILSRNGILRVEKNFLNNSYRVGKDILEIQYYQFWRNGASSVYSEHVMRIGEDEFEVFASELSAKRMVKFR